MKPLLFVLLAAALLTGARADEAPAFSVRFGTLRVDQAAKKYVLDRETTTLPRRFKDTGFRWGFDITPAVADTSYSCQFVVHLPQPPDQVTGNIGDNTTGKPTNTIASAEFKVVGGRYLRQFWFDPGDPRGEWSLDVLVNGKIVRTITFQVMDE